MGKFVSTNPLLSELRRITEARIGLARAGCAVTTQDNLAFQRDHARARDAVHVPFDAEHLRAQIAALGFDTLLGSSAAGTRRQYLQRPDWGRRLARDSVRELEECADDVKRKDFALVVTDGLSSTAMHENAVPFLTAFRRQAATTSWTLAPVTIVKQGRVAIGDQIGELLRARCVAVLLGERPGLSAANSMGIYLTLSPQIGRTDADRNCISNIRSNGLGHAEAARKLAHLIAGAFRLGKSGVELKDDAMTFDALPNPDIVSGQTSDF